MWRKKAEEEGTLRFRNDQRTSPRQERRDRLPNWAVEEQRKSIRMTSPHSPKWEMSHNKILNDERCVRIVTLEI